MKLYTLTRRFTAAVLTAAMALSFCAPALAEAPGTAADPAAPAASAPAENSTADTIVFDKLYFGTREDWDWTIVGAPSGDVVLHNTPPQTAPSPSPEPTSRRSPSPRPA